MRHLPWLSAGVSRAAWERARNAVVGHVADLAWRGRETPNARIDDLADEPMQRLAEMARGDRDATLYGLSLAERQRRDG